MSLGCDSGIDGHGGAFLAFKGSRSWYGEEDAWILERSGEYMGNDQVCGVTVVPDDIVVCVCV